MMNLEFDHLTDIEQHLLIKEEIRGGVAMINHQYDQANALGMENYDANKPNSYIIYLDANNLYG